MLVFLFPWNCITRNRGRGDGRDLHLSTNTNAGGDAAQLKEAGLETTKARFATTSWAGSEAEREGGCGTTLRRGKARIKAA